MTLSNFSLLPIALLLCVLSKAHGEPIQTDCLTSSPTIPSLQKSECKFLDQIAVVTYKTSIPDSPYATEFDQRHLAFTCGKDTEKLKNIAGLVHTSKGLILQSTLLTTPLFAENILSRKVNKNPKKYHGWKIYKEEIHYGKSGKEAGFPMDCATALYTETNGSMVVSECFSLQEKKRFLQTLDEINKSTVLTQCLSN